MRENFPFKTLGLGFTLVAMMVAMYLFLRPRPAPTAPREPLVVDGERVPDLPPGVGTDPRATARFVREQACLSNCATDRQACEAANADTPERCAGERAACERACGEAPR